MSNYSAKAISSKEYAVCLAGLQDKLPRPLHFLHAAFYGQWQEKSGKQVLYFSVTKNDQLVGVGMAINYPLPGGLRYLYCPYGPLLVEWSSGAVDAIKTLLHHQAASSTIFARFDTESATPVGFVTPSNATAATASLQPRREWVLDISAPEADILSGFYKTARYQIRLADRSDTTVRFEPFTAHQLDKFYELLTTTAGRNSFGIMPKSYYEAVFSQLADTPGSFLAFADVTGDPAAAAVIASFDGQAHYVFGCSSSTYRRIAPSYKLLFECMKKAKTTGDTLFNFGGISDAVKSTKLDGVTDFKKRFGGYAVEHAKPVDLPLNPLLYRLFTLYKKIKRH